MSIPVVVVVRGKTPCALVQMSQPSALEYEHEHGGKAARVTPKVSRSAKHSPSTLEISSYHDEPTGRRGSGNRGAARACSLEHVKVASTKHRVLKDSFNQQCGFSHSATGALNGANEERALTQTFVRSRGDWLGTSVLRELFGIARHRL